MSFLVREVLETEDNYPDAVKALQQSELMAPVYLTIAGVSPGEGCVLTRDRKAVVDGSGGNDDGGINSGGITEQLGNGTTVVVQTNMDIPLCDKDNTDDDWQDICASRVRRRFAKAALHGLGEGGGSITMDGEWLSLSSLLLFCVVLNICGTNIEMASTVVLHLSFCSWYSCVYIHVHWYYCCIVQICGNWSVLRHAKLTTPCIQRVWCRERVNW